MMFTQDSGYQEVPSTPYLNERHLKTSFFEVPNSSPLSRPQNFQTRSQASSGFSREQNVPCTPAASSVSSISSRSTTTTLTVPSQAEQTVPRTPRAQRIQNLKMLWNERRCKVIEGSGDRSVTSSYSSGPGVKRSVEQKRRIEAIVSLRTVPVNYLFVGEDIFG